ncbi:MAG: DUF5048 domain-containing protein [Clostridia bacterium]|nr:DUF5048 domain-containing protein [Clostridia bacterium]
MAFNITQNDYDIYKQQSIKKYVKINLLDFKYNILDEISGNIIGMSVKIDANSDIRRTCSCQLVVVDSSFDIEPGGRIWLDRYIQPYVGYENLLSGEIQWYNQGIFLINAPSWSYNSETNVLSFEGLDLMSKLTGIRNGNLEGIPTVISQGENVREAIIDTIAMGGFTKYVVSECLTKSGEIQEIPYDINIDVGGTLFDILKALRDILPQYQIYFDVDGVFHYDMIPSGDNEQVLYDDEFLTNIVTDEKINVDFESVKNVVEVVGCLLDPSYFNTATVVVYSNDTVIANLNLPDLYYVAESVGQIQPFTTIGFVLDQNITSEFGIHITANIDEQTGHDFGIAYLYDYNDERVTSLTAGVYYVFTVNAEQKLYLMGERQIRSIAKDENPDSPFYIGNDLGEIRIVLSGGEYDNIYNQKLADERAAWELWKRTRLNDAISLSCVPIPFIDVNGLLEYHLRGNGEINKYIIKSIQTDYATGGQQTISAIKYYPYYNNEG